MRLIPRPARVRKLETEALFEAFFFVRWTE